MKAVTEFANVTLSKGLKAKAALAAEGKTPEEIQASLGESFKYEGDKLTYFIKALDIATENPENLKRVIVMRLGEGENAPPKATKVEDLCYIPESLILTIAKPAAKEDGKGGRHGRGGGKGGGRGGPGGGKKESPWGLSPEEKAAKNAKKPAGGTPAS